jgi:3-deoxy-D-manno-octulosonate 8-phosphate phosphatase (KDO 8-P phosphatase)
MTSTKDPAGVHRLAVRIRLLLMDCDGVLTDGRIFLGSGGIELKSFHIRDGQGLVLLHHAGIRSGVISGRRSEALDSRATELGMTYVRQGSHNKLRDFAEIVQIARVEEKEVAFIADDIGDLPVMARSGLAVAVADAVPEVLQAAHYITQAPGGRGAVREVCDLLLKAQDLAHYSK